MSNYTLRINDKLVRDRLIQNPQSDDDAKVIIEGNVVGNILKLYAELDPLACYADWGQEGKEGKVIYKARQNGNVLTVGDKCYDFRRDFNITITQERCYRKRNGGVTNEEPYWILAPAAEAGYWLVIKTDRDTECLKRILEMCAEGFFKRYGIDSVELKEVP